MKGSKGDTGKAVWVGGWAGLLGVRDGEGGGPAPWGLTRGRQRVSCALAPEVSRTVLPMFRPQMPWPNLQHQRGEQGILAPLRPWPAFQLWTQCPLSPADLQWGFTGQGSVFEKGVLRNPFLHILPGCSGWEE